jgi:D-alanine-D-alanine ligase
VPLDISPHDVPVLLLYDPDPSWTPQESEGVLSLDAAIASVGHPVTTVPVLDDNLAAVLSRYDPMSYVVFNWCESIPGKPHSDAMVARTLESLGFTFTGASSLTLVLAEDRYRVKQILNQAGIPTPEWRIYKQPAAEGWTRFPAIVKTANEHCSIGITSESIVTTETELCERIDHILRSYNQPALVEDFIDGREFHVSFWGYDKIEMLPPAEIDFSTMSDMRDRLLTYDSKCTPGSLAFEATKIRIPVELNKADMQMLESVAKAAYTSIGCRDYGRIDIRERDGIYYVLDVNPNADITANASMARAAALAGYSYGEMGSHIVMMAAKRHPVLGTLKK